MAKATMNYRELRSMAQTMKPEEMTAHITEALEAKEIKPEDFSIRGLFEATVPDGRDIVEAWGQGESVKTVMEAGVTSDLFKNINGQILYTAMMEGYENPIFLADRLCKTVPTKFDGEKIPGITGLGDNAAVIREGQPYPKLGVTEDWVETPQTTKRGGIVEITKEAIFFDRTAMILTQCNKLGESLGINKEKRVLDLAMGVTTAWKPKGTSTATYGNTSGLHDFDNQVNSNELADYTDIQNVLALFQAITDPGTGEPIVINPSQVLLRWNESLVLRRILNAQQVEYNPNNSANTANIISYFSPSTVIPQQLEILTNPWVASRMSAGSVNTGDFFTGEFQKAFWYMENWSIQTDSRGTESEAAWERDVVQQYKASERGACAVINPRYVVQSSPAS